MIHKLSVVQSPEVILIAKFVQNNSWKSPLCAAVERPDHFRCEDMIMNHFNAHKFITEEFREKLNKNELPRIGKIGRFLYFLWSQEILGNTG